MKNDVTALDEYHDRLNGIESDDQLVAADAELESALCSLRVIEARVMKAIEREWKLPNSMQIGLSGAMILRRVDYK